MKSSLLVILSIFLGLTRSSSQDYFDRLERSEKSQNKIVYWQYGLIQFEKDFAKEKVAKHYNFYFSHVAGCAVTKETISRIAKHNKWVDKKLIKTLGMDWKRKVYDAVDSVYKIDTTLINHFYIDKTLVDTLNKMADEIKEPYEFRVTPTSNPGIYLINAFLLDKDWKVTQKSILKIEATYPDITYKIIFEDPNKRPITLHRRNGGAMNVSSTSYSLSLLSYPTRF